MSMLQSLLIYFSIFATARLAAIPDDWIKAVEEKNALFAEKDDEAAVLGPLLGNGYFSNDIYGVRSDSYFVSGVFNGESTSPSHRARIPATMAFTVRDSKTTGTLLHMLEGYFSRRGTVSSLQSTLEYELKWYAHRSRRNVYICEFKVLKFDGVIPISISLENNSGSASEDISFEKVKTPEKNFQLECGSTNTPEVLGGKKAYLCVASSDWKQNIVIAPKDIGKIIPYLTVVYTSLDKERLNKDNFMVKLKYSLTKLTMEKTIQKITLKLWVKNRALLYSGSNTLQKEHVLAWKELWSSGIEVSGRDELSIAINASFFAILSSVRDDWPYGLSPGGITNFYNGHSFWDTETWMYPSLLPLFPSIAQSLMQYRYERLPGAYQKAQSYIPPYEGAMFPWESAFTGVETCPSQYGTGLREQHISADIALGVFNYYLFTKDLQWLNKTGWPILEGVAEFLRSKIVYNESGAATTGAHINDVIGPDEFADHINDSVFTNYGAKLALNYTLQAAELLGIDLKEKKGTYTKLRDDLVILFDDSQKIHPEYFGYRGNQVKQADAVLLQFPLKMPMSMEVTQNDLNYYESRTDPQGPAMTWAIFAINSLDIGNYEQADKYFSASFKENIHPPYMVWTETPSGGAGNFITGAGGFLQTMIYGYPGIRVYGDSLTFTPLCPEGVPFVRVKGIHYVNIKFEFIYRCMAGEMFPYEIEVNLIESGGLLESQGSYAIVEYFDDVKKISEELKKSVIIKASKLRSLIKITAKPSVVSTE